MGFIVGSFVVGACTAPPSVAPLLRVAERAMVEEAAHVEGDATRDAAQLRQMRAALTAGFDADLAANESPSAGWVKGAAEGYAAAREELARHEAALRVERETRADNLRAAAEAQQRAISLIERQDELITRTIGLDAWRMQFNRPLGGLTRKENR